MSIPSFVGFTVPPIHWKSGNDINSPYVLGQIYSFVYCFKGFPNINPRKHLQERFQYTALVHLPWKLNISWKSSTKRYSFNFKIGKKQYTAGYILQYSSRCLTEESVCFPLYFSPISASR